MKPTCPKCGFHEIVTIEKIQGSAGLIDISEGQPEWDGYTEVHWETTETIGICCLRCLYEEYTVDDFDYNDWVGITNVLTKKDDWVDITNVLTKKDVKE